MLVPTLLAAIADPGKHTRNTLEVRIWRRCFALQRHCRVAKLPGVHWQARLSQFVKLTSLLH